jgi:hypothetical protein
VEKPLGVTLMAILIGISGVLLIIAGAGAMSIIPLFGGASVWGIAAGAVTFALGVGSLVVAYGLFKGRWWAWAAAAALSLASIVVAIISMIGGNYGGIISVIVNGLTLYYLFKPHVRAYFGRKSAAASRAGDAAAA